MLQAQRIVLEEIGFNTEALDWHAHSGHGFPALLPYPMCQWYHLPAMRLRQYYFQA